jgi:Methyltransferase FkbM domain
VRMTSNSGGLDHVVTGEAIPDTVEVPLTRIDDLLAGRVPLAMKIDVEGFELVALKGAAATLASPDLHAVVIELQDWTLRKFGTSESECRELLASFGFAAHGYSPADRSLSRLSHGNGAELNEIFVRPSAFVEHRLREGRDIEGLQLPSARGAI